VRYLRGARLRELHLSRAVNSEMGRSRRDQPLQQLTVPTAAAAPTVHHGTTFVIDSPQASDIARVVLVRPMAVTHQTDTEQRIIQCAFSQTGANQLSAIAPNGIHPHAIAPRGYYLVFLLTGAGIPSEGSFIHLH
jgi:hypothetical protein